MVASKLHCFYCFDVLAAHLQGADPKTVPPPAGLLTTRAEATDELLDDDDDDDDKHGGPSSTGAASYPLFVTWSTTPKLTLRGCIGNFSPLPLPQGLRDYALISATQDHRFPPIRARELPTLHVGVSLLVGFEPCAHPFDWVIGLHGIRVAFTCPTSKRPLGATFLPEVASDQAWDHKRTLVQLVKKAGYVGPWDKVKDQVKLVRYQTRKATCSYQEFVVWVEAGRRYSVEVHADEEDAETTDGKDYGDEDVSSSA